LIAFRIVGFGLYASAEVFFLSADSTRNTFDPIFVELSKSQWEKQKKVKRNNPNNHCLKLVRSPQLILVFFAQKGNNKANKVLPKDEHKDPTNFIFFALSLFIIFKSIFKKIKQVVELRFRRNKEEQCSLE